MLSRSLGILLLLGLATTACQSHDCTAVGYVPLATMEREITSSIDPSKPLHIELCFRDECTSGDFVPDTGVASQPGLCVGENELFQGDGCTLRRTTDGHWQFSASWNLTNKAPKNGDRYRATVSSAEGSLLSIDVNAVYVDSEPNGEGCGITKNATL